MTISDRMELPRFAVFSMLMPRFALLVGAPTAIALAVLYGLPGHAVASFFVMAHVTGFGVTLGLHRLFCHRSFATSRTVERVLMICGSMSCQSSPFFWIATHRQHHSHSDCDGDPHSPHAGAERRGWLRRFWHAHQGWALGLATYNPALIRDLAHRRDLVWINRHWSVWYLLGLALPALAGYLIGGTAYDALMGLLWGGLLRQAISEQGAFAINSICHTWGSRAYATGEHSRNNFFLALFTFGEGWHNNHHAFPYSARHGFRWWQTDSTWGLVWLMERVGMVWKVKRPKLAILPVRAAAEREPAHAKTA